MTLGKNAPPAAKLIEKTVDKLRIDSAWLRMNSREETDANAALVLETCSLKIRRMADAVERLARTLVKVDTPDSLRRSQE
jgi:hypothetical protein